MVDGQIRWMLEGQFPSREAFPVYGDSVAIEFSKESEQEFFRPKLSGELTFCGQDYSDIMAAPFSTKFMIVGEVWQNGGFEEFVSAHFYKTDCEIDVDGQTIKVTPTVSDEYELILDCLEKEYNLVSLAPEITPLTAMKRPIIQLYRPNYNKVACILSGMYWEQDAKSVSETNLSQYSFSQIAPRFFSALLDGEGDIGGDIPTVFLNSGGSADDPITKDGYTLTPGYNSSLNRYTLQITDSDSTLLWNGYRNYTTGRFGIYTMVPMAGQTGTLTIVFRSEAMYCRIVCDVDSIRGNNTSPIPQDDITENNYNYSRVIGYVPQNSLAVTDSSSQSPTEYGLMPDGDYYQRPYWPFGDVIPALRSSWDGISIWWLGSPIDWLAEQDGRKEFTINDTYPLWSVLSVLLAKNNTGLTFAGTSEYSDFLYGATNPIRNANYELYLTPKSNIVSSEYEKAAQRGDISLKMVFDMLRDCFRCYWFIDGTKLRIEHIEFFRRGGSYSSVPTIGLNLVTSYYSRSGKAIAAGQNKYKYDKPDTYSRIEFGWMDDVTAQFNGSPIDIVSDYVQKNRVEKKDITNFTSDIDYILFNPSEVSKDGFALLCANNGTIPFVSFGSDDTYVLQNGYLSFMWLERYYMYDLPAPDYEIDGVPGTALGTVKIRTQEVMFPSSWLPDLQKLVETGLGSGQIKSLSISLVDLTCKATLIYGTT